MKKLFGVLLLGASITPISSPIKADCDCDVISHTFFSVRPLYQIASPERVASNHTPIKRDNGWGGNLQLAVLGGKSTKNNKLEQFFSPVCKRTLVVKEVPDAETDLIAQNFNIATVNGVNVERTGPGFESNIELEMRQSVFALGATYRQNISMYWDENCEKPWWFEISSPLTRVTNHVRINEQIVSDGGGVATAPGLPEEQQLFDSMTAAFAQPEWLYGRIDPRHKQSRWGLADIEFYVGYSWLNGECCGVESYFGVVIPTGNRPKAHYVFEPIVGNNHHAGIIWGHSAFFQIWEGDCWVLNTYVDSNCKYLFRSKERRSFDLKNKPWSRYLALYADFSQAQQANALLNAGNAVAAAMFSTPGINILTQEVNVKPRFVYTMNVATVATNDCWDLEGGFNFYAHEKECLSLRNLFQEVAAIKANVGAGEVNAQRTINNDLTATNLAFSQANYNLATIKATDLDFESAAHPAVLSYTIYGAASYRWEDMCLPMFAGIGASYEFGGGNEVLNRWTAWGKFGFAF